MLILFTQLLLNNQNCSHKLAFPKNKVLVWICTHTMYMLMILRVALHFTAALDRSLNRIIIGWYCGAGVCGLTGCISFSLSPALPTFFNNNNNNNNTSVMCTIECRVSFQCHQHNKYAAFESQTLLSVAITEHGCCSAYLRSIILFSRVLGAKTATPHADNIAK